VKAGQPGHNNLVSGNAGTFINMASNMCLGGLASNFRQQACRFLERTDQRFTVTLSQNRTLFQGVNGCLGPLDGGTANGVPMSNVTCGTTESLWTSQNPVGQFRQYKNEKSGKCMYTSGMYILQGFCTDNPPSSYWVFSD
jgi:hypothetical protein